MQAAVPRALAGRLGMECRHGACAHRNMTNALLDQQRQPELCDRSTAWFRYSTRTPI